MTNLRKLTPRQEDRRQRILAAARELVADQGYDGMVMIQVAERAGVSPTTLYNLYNTKDQLVLEALRELLAENVVRVSAESDGPGWKYLIKMVQNGAWKARTAPAYAEAITAAMLRAGSGDALIEVLLANTKQEIHDSLLRMRDTGQLDLRVDTDQLATALLGLYWSSFLLWNKGLVHLQEFEHTLQINFIGLLLPATQGDARAGLDALYQELLDQS
ncbi:MAG: TetR/AcrR family transcriptional regulator [Proteobacteria bacterium]|nr:TetR/AcrR family transcriptional regulator [Pseudomonadota bacterium]